MAQLILNSAVVVLVASAFLTTAIAALRESRPMQKAPVKVKARHRPRG